MPKIVKCLKCLKLRYSIDFIKRKKQGMRLYSFADFWFFMLKIPGVYNKDGATRGAHAAQALALRERLRCASEATILGILGILAHFRHFPVYPG